MFFQTVLEQGLIFGIMALGVLISYKILDFPDLSVDGSFPLGAAVVAISLTSGVPAPVALILAAMAGSIAGGITGLIHTRFKITHLLSGIIVMIGLYSINIRVMKGSPNMQLFNVDHIFKVKDIALGSIQIPSKMLILIVIAVLAKIALDKLLKTQFGFVLRALGDNPQVVTGLGLNSDLYKIMGLMVSGALISFAGGLMAQYQGYTDINMGTGMLVVGLASIILGENILGRFKGIGLTTIAILGAITYRLIVGMAFVMGLPPSDLKLVTAVVLLGILIFERHRPKRAKAAKAN